jgi:hypothetical protein
MTIRNREVGGSNVSARCLQCEAIRPPLTNAQDLAAGRLTDSLRLVKTISDVMIPNGILGKL